MNIKSKLELREQPGSWKHMLAHWSVANRTLIVSEWWFNEANVACCEWNQFCECAECRQAVSPRSTKTIPCTCKLTSNVTNVMMKTSRVWPALGAGTDALDSISTSVGCRNEAYESMQCWL